MGLYGPNLLIPTRIGQRRKRGPGMVRQDLEKFQAQTPRSSPTRRPYSNVRVSIRQVYIIKSGTEQLHISQQKILWANLLKFFHLAVLLLILRDSTSHVSHVKFIACRDVTPDTLCDTPTVTLAYPISIPVTSNKNSRIFTFCLLK